MEDYLLDTNAFIYLTDMERGKVPAITVDKKSIDAFKFHEVCTKAHCLYITSQSLYELLWQSVKLNDFDTFVFRFNEIKKIREKYNIGFSILNDEGLWFDFNEMRFQLENNCLDIDTWINSKRVYEAQKLSFLIFTIYTALMMLIFEEYGINITDEYCALIKRIIEVRLVTFSEKYYDLKSRNQYTNNDYDRYIDETILMVVSMTIKQVYEQLKYSSVPKILYIPDEGNYVSGITYISDFMKKNKVEDSKWFAKYDKQIEDMIYEMSRQRNLHEETTLFIKRLCDRVIKQRTKLRKNDGIDFGIVTCFDNHNLINETSRDFNKSCTYILSFDRNIFLFSKENNILYNKDLYDKLWV